MERDPNEGGTDVGRDIVRDIVRRATGRDPRCPAGHPLAHRRVRSGERARPGARIIGVASRRA